GYAACSPFLLNSACSLAQKASVFGTPQRATSSCLFSSDLEAFREVFGSRFFGRLHRVLSPQRSGALKIVCSRCGGRGSVTSRMCTGDFAALLTRSVGSYFVAVVTFGSEAVK